MGSARKTGELIAEGTLDPFDVALAHEIGRAREETDCPDSDSIGAYYETDLPKAEASAYEKHFAHCIRCQSQLATLARTDESIDSSTESRRSESRFGVWIVVGLGAVAAAVVALVLANQTRQQSSIQTALAPQARPSPTSPNAPFAQGSAGGSIEATQAAPIPTPGLVTVPSAAPVPTAELAMAPPRAAQSVPRTVVSQTSAENSGGSVTRPVVRPKIAAQEPASELPKSAGVTIRTQAPKLRPVIAKSEMQKSDAPTEPNTSIDEENALPQPSSPPRFALSSPSESAYWRIGTDGSISWSHGGEKWESQREGDGTNLKTGMATDAFVCWLVGENGTILRSIDGTTWSRVSSPTDDDLIGVSVGNAYVATITTSTGRRYRTTNGGRDWNLIWG